MNRTGKRMSLRSFLLLVMIIFMIACTSRRLQLSPVSEDTYWRQGRECIGLANDQLEIHLYPESVSASQLVWYVEISNLGDQRIDVFPSRFYLRYWKDAGDTAVQRFYARDPESQINRIEKEKDRETDSHLVSSSTELTFCCLSFFSSIVHTAKGEHEEAEEDKELSDEAMERLDEEQEEHESRMYELETEQDYWENTVFRSTTIMKEETAGGLIIFQTPRDAKHLVLYFPIENSIMQIEYTMTWIEL
jgi:hypothetical protein